MSELTDHPVPVSPEALSDLLAETCLAAVGGTGSGRLRVALDGADAAEPGRLADRLVEPLRAGGVAAVRVSAGDFLRPASLRWEFGKTDPDSFYSSWLDTGALTREVLTPWAEGGRYLPAFWDAGTDRSARADYRPVPPRAVLLVDGPLLLGHGLPFDLSVHVRLSPGALRRRTPADEAWTLPAFVRYEEEVAPGAIADVVVRADDPRHPAVIVRG
ncbi:uridine kinase [Cryptosporangium aurantiacum]|uniref:uridine kinase n=1 Tax=Cryptosporangium aurantiacum TaxID=134849 RepID=UPI001160FCB9|nr:uridine kinase [Cryptosporangium aurantiacum]